MSDKKPPPQEAKTTRPAAPRDWEARKRNKSASARKRVKGERYASSDLFWIQDAASGKYRELIDRLADAVLRKVVEMILLQANGYIDTHQPHTRTFKKKNAPKKRRAAKKKR